MIFPFHSIWMNIMSALGRISVITTAFISKSLDYSKIPFD